MKTNVSEYDFCRAFEESESRKDQFTHSAQRALYEYLIDYEESCDTEIDFDMIALCCEYAEYDSALEAATEYGFEPSSEAADNEHQEQNAESWLEDRTTVIPFNGVITLSDGSTLGDRGVIIQQF